MGPQIGGMLRAFAFLILTLASASQVRGFALEGVKWPAGSQIAISLELGSTNVHLQDGSGTWSNSAADALSIWNQHIDSIKFTWSTGPGPAWGGDKKSSVFFSTTVFGQSFGNYVLAVTWYRYSEETYEMTEGDVIFNKNVTWNSYRGPRQAAAFDFHRVALHEFGHVLGLDHPDESGQGVTALMNSVIGDLDHLADDDIAGARFLYGLRITSPLADINARIGDSFTYQITADNSPTGFEASGLPPGLQLNSATGLISGTLGAAGTFNVTLIAHGPARDVSATLRIIIIGPTITGPLSLNVDVTENFRYQISASQSASSFNAAGLPPGLSLDTATGLITGNPTAVGTFTVMVTAYTASGDATATVRITVRPPRITSSTVAPNVEIGGIFSYQITATGQPTHFSAIALPDGLQIDPATGVVSGVPTLSGPHQITVTAHTPYGDASTTLQIFVTKAPSGDSSIARFPVTSVHELVADPVRPRVYVATSQAILVIDTQSLT